jgi:hypothetical protein
MITQSIDIPNALRLDSQTVDSLMKGDIIAAIPRTFTNAGRTFALYPDQPDRETVTISAWARCEQCDIVDDSKPLDIISHYTAIPIQRLQQIIAEYESFFLIYLRVYRLSKLITIPTRSQGQYVALPDRLKVDDSSPVLSDHDFEIQKQRLLNLQPPESFFEKIKRKLDEVEDLQQIELIEKIDWVRRIASVGNSSEGNDFEKLVRKGLIKLGFSTTKYQEFLDPNKCGGAGGLDFYCDTPFAVVGECKATKSEKVPDGTAAQLVKLGFKHLQKEYYSCIKIIMAAGKLTEDAELTAIGNQMNVLRPETLQRLVELKSKYSGAINLFELKTCLEQVPHGEAADEKLNDFIEKVKYAIMVRSRIVQAVKRLADMGTTQPNFERICTQYNAMFYTDSESILHDHEVRDYLIELSSPLAGYLGRVEEKGEKCERFYYLRDLPT